MQLSSSRTHCPSVRRKSCIVRMPLRMAVKVSLPRLEQFTGCDPLHKDSIRCITIPWDKLTSKQPEASFRSLTGQGPYTSHHRPHFVPLLSSHTMHCTALSLGSNYPTNHVHWNRPVCSHRSVCVVKHLSNGSYMCYSTTAHKSTLLVQKLKL
jgi:hypothetical protein